MILIIGLVILGIALLLAVVGVGTNSGPAHSLKGDFALFGQHMTGLSTGQLLLGGIVVGLLGALGLSILRGFFARGLASRDLQRELKKSRAETAALRVDFDRVTKEFDTAKAENLSHRNAVNPPLGQSPTPTA